MSNEKAVPALAVICAVLAGLCIFFIVHREPVWTPHLHEEAEIKACIAKVTDVKTGTGQCAYDHVELMNISSRRVQHPDDKRGIPCGADLVIGEDRFGYWVWKETELAKYNREGRARWLTYDRKTKTIKENDDGTDCIR